MRPDPDTCRDPDLLAAEVRRLKNVLAADDPWLTDAEREAVACGISHILDAEHYGGDEPLAVVALRGLLKRLKCESTLTPAEIERLRLSDEEQEAVEWCIFQQATPQRLAAVLRGLLDRTDTGGK